MNLKTMKAIINATIFSLLTAQNADSSKKLPQKILKNEIKNKREDK